MRAAALLLATLLATRLAAAQTPAEEAPLLVTGATLHTVSGPVLAGGRLLVERGRITAVLAADAPLPATRGPAPRVIDLAGKHVYPGFIAANTALGLTEVASVAATVDHAEAGPVNPHARAVVAINADSELLPVARANGVLSALVLPGTAPGGSIAGRAALIQLAGRTWEELALEPEAALQVVLPTMRLGRERLAALPEPLQQEYARFAAERLRRIEEAFGAAQDYLRARAAAPELPADQRWESMRPYLAGQRPVFVLADELPQIRHALGLAERFGLKLVIVGGADAWRIADVLRERRVPVVIGGVLELPTRRDEDIDARYALAARLHAAGVEFCIARNGDVFGAANERNLPYEAASAAAHGLPRDEALRAITLYPARILGVADRLGALAPGLLASFIVTDGDPLEAGTKVERAFISGREVDLSNRQTRLTERYARPPAPR